MSYQSSGYTLPDASVGFTISGPENTTKVPKLRLTPTDIINLCSEVSTTCANCLNRNLRGRCVGPGINSGRYCGDNSPICDNFDMRK